VIHRRDETIHEGKYAAEVPVDLIEEQGGWSPYFTFEDAQKLESVRLALRSGDIAEDAKYGRVFELTPLAAKSAGLDHRSLPKRRRRRRRNHHLRHTRGHREEEAQLHRAVPGAVVGAAGAAGEEAGGGGGVNCFFLMIARADDAYAVI
jgi:hypothetical protein